MPDTLPRPPLPLLLALLLAAPVGCAHGRSAPAADPGAADVTADDIRRDPSVSIEELLQASAPGARVTRTPGGGIAIRIRGASSLRGDNLPLYVLDGMAVEPGPQGSVPGINPHDIASIRVLTDPVDTAMYGVRGANGVIVIRTKRPGG